MFARTIYNPYVSDIQLSTNQQKYLVNQVISTLHGFYAGTDNRDLVLNAFTGSGKTTVAIKTLIPDYVSAFYPIGKRITGFMAPRKEVVDKAYRVAKETIDETTVNGARIRVYNSEDIDLIKKRAKRGQRVSLEGDVVVLFITAQYFYNNYNLLSSNGTFDLMIVDEAHIMFGTISKEDTKADKGTTNNNFVAETLTKLRSLSTCAVLYLTATPTNSQKELTPLGTENNIYLDPMPRDVLTTPFYEVVSYIDHEETVFDGIKRFKNKCDIIADLISNIEPDTWDMAKENFFPTYPAIAIRLGQANSNTGVLFEEGIDDVAQYAADNNMELFVSTSKYKEFGGQYIASLDEGVSLAEKHNHKPVVLVTVNSGYAGMDLVKITDVIIGRDPKGTVHNNYSQTAGRAARMKFGFRNHADAANAIRNYDISDVQKRLLAEYYIIHSTSMVHVQVYNKLLTGDVKSFIETDTYREHEGRKFVLDTTFGVGNAPALRLSTRTTIENNGYQRYKKTYCECCEVPKLWKNTNHTSCFVEAYSGFKRLFNMDLRVKEMELLWPLCLHVHHQDGNHFNNNPENLITLCPNVHALITVHNEDYKNRYPKLREALTKLADKKGVVLPESILNI